MSEKNELVEQELNQVITQSDINFLKEFENMKAKFNFVDKRIKEQVKKIMVENGIKSYDFGDLKITYKAPTIRKSVDTEALKEQGIYDDFVKESKVSDSVQITVRYEE